MDAFNPSTSIQRTAPLVVPESSYNELTVLATEEKTPEVFPLAAERVFENRASLPETRVRGLPAGNHAGVGGCWPVTSTFVWGCGYTCDGTASGSLDQRFYASTYGRFLTPDPARKSARLRNPQSWNRYSYALGDPVNRFDPRGTCDQTTYSGSIDADGNWTISVDCADYPAWSWGDLFTGFWESLSGPSYSNGTPCYICLRQAAAEMQDVPFGDPVYAAQVVQAVNGLNAGGFLNAFMVFSTATGLGAADIVGAANAFAAGEAGAHAIVLGTSTNLAAGTSGYVEIGGVLGAETLSMTPAQWAALGTEGQEAAMAGFIDGAIQRGAQIIFTSDPSLAAAAGNVGTAFEYSYLTDTLGYNIVQQGTSWVAVAP